MKNLDLDKYGVQEMNIEELQKTEGGGFWVAFWVGTVVGGMLYSMASDSEKCCRSFADGFRDASK